MKISISILFSAVLIATLLFSCNKDKIPNGNNLNCIATDTTNTYNLRIKPIMDAHCATIGCHDAGTASATVILDNYNSTKDALNTKNVLCAMRYETNCIPMPPSGKLNDTLINHVRCWKEAGFPN